MENHNEKKGSAIGTHFKAQRIVKGHFRNRIGKTGGVSRPKKRNSKMKKTDNFMKMINKTLEYFLQKQVSLTF